MFKNSFEKYILRDGNRCSGASLNCELWVAYTHVIFERVSDNFSPALTPHKFRASTELQPRIPRCVCLRNRRWSAQRLY